MNLDPEIAATLEGLPAELFALYGIKPLTCCKQGNTWRVECAEGIYLVSECLGDAEKLEKGLEWQDYLTKRGFTGVLTPVKKSPDQSYVKLNGKAYRIEMYPPHDAFDGKIVEHLVLVAEGLGKMHALSKEYPINTVGSCADRSWSGIYQTRLTELLSFFTMLRQDRARNDFERIYAEGFDFLYSQGQEALQKMTMAKCRIEAAVKNDIMLVNSFSPSQLAIRNKQALFLNILEWDTGLNVNDLALFINSYLPLHGWKRELLGMILERYCESRPLSTCEKNFLWAHLRFPNRCWFYTYRYVNAADMKNVSELTQLLKSYLQECYRRDCCLDSLSAWLWEEEK